MTITEKITELEEEERALIAEMHRRTERATMPEEERQEALRVRGRVWRIRLEVYDLRDLGKEGK